MLQQAPKRVYLYLIFLISFLLLIPSNALAADSTGIFINVQGMEIPRNIFGAALLQDGNVLVTGGFDDTTNLYNSSEIYNPTARSWVSTGDLNLARLLWVTPGLVPLKNGGVLVSAGQGSNVTDLGSTEIYDPGSGNWTSIANINTPRRRAILAPLPDGKVLLAGGAHGGSGSDRFLSSSEIYDPSNNSWTNTGSLTYGRETGTQFVVLADGRIMIGGGQSVRTWPSNYEDTAEIYNQNTGIWTLTNSMPYSWSGATMTLLADGRVLVTGGFDGSKNTTLTAIYNPTNNSWKNTAPMKIARSSHRAILLSDGKVLVLGGVDFGTFNAVTASSEIYDPTTDSWTDGPSFPEPLSPWIALKLSNGDYLIAGGSDSSGNASRATYLFTEVNKQLSLPVPLLKQTSNPWQKQVYDSADIWSPKDKTINSWGCALTSAAMILQYNGITKLPDNTTLDPGTLNKWLKKQPDGYVGNGLVNWLAISRLSKDAKSVNPNFQFDALQYSRLQGSDDNQVTDDLSNNIPDILQEPGHFVVAKGADNGVIAINDPYYNRNTLNDAYNNSYLSIGRFVPSHTDLSYILLVVDQGVTVHVKDSAGSQIGTEIIEQPIVNPNSDKPSGEPVKIVYVPQPSTGDYHIILSSATDTTFHAELYLYDQNGEVRTFSTDGVLTGGSDKTIPFSLNKVEVSRDTAVNSVTIDEFYSDIKTLQSLRKLNVVTGLLLTTSLKDIEKDYNNGKKAQALKRIKLFRLVLVKLPKNLADEQVSAILLSDLDGLKYYIQNTFGEST